MTTTTTKSRSNGDAQEIRTDRLKVEFQNLLSAARERAFTSVNEKLGDAAGRLNDYVEHGGGPGLMAALTGAKGLTEGKSPARALLGAGLAGAKGKIGRLSGGGDKGGQGQKAKVTNIVESIDVGVPVRVAYNQWTQFRDFPSFMKKVESVEQESDEKLQWRAQILWSHRNWESTVLQQVPDKMIVWRSKGDKGYVDGAVTFHELTPDLTRILLVLEYNAKGFFEQTGNLWRAQGRRARLELKHFRRHVMTQAILHPDEIEGWRGVIEDGEVVKDHETALQEEQQGRAEGEREDAESEEELPESEAAQVPGDEVEEGAEEEGAEDEYEYEDEDEGERDGEPEDEAEPPEDEAEPPEDEAEPPEDEEEPPEDEEEPEPVDQGRGTGGGKDTPPLRRGQGGKAQRPAPRRSSPARTRRART